MDHPLDPETLRSLREIMQEDFAALLEAYRSDAQLRLRQMRRALTLADRDALRQAAHSFKGSSLNVGALELSDACLQMEMAAPDAAPADLEVLLTRLESAFPQVEARIDEELTR